MLAFWPCAPAARAGSIDRLSLRSLRNLGPVMDDIQKFINWVIGLTGQQWLYFGLCFFAGILFALWLATPAPGK